MSPAANITKTTIQQPSPDGPPTLKIIQPSPMPPNAAAPGAWPTPEQLERWNELVAADAAYRRNVQATADFLTAWRNWFVSYDAGRGRAVPPPAPPNGFTAHLTAQTIGGASEDDRFDLVQDGGPVCDPPAYIKLPGDPALSAVAAPAAIAPEPVDVIQAPPGDAVPVGVVITAPDGSRWQKHATRSPFGVAQFYQRVG